MTDELKACPFCGKTAYIKAIDNGKNGYNVVCENDDCTGYGPWDLGKSGATETWNTRPLEDALRKQLAERDATLGEMVRLGFDNVGDVIETIKGIEAQLATRDADLARAMRYITGLEKSVPENNLAVARLSLALLERNALIKRLQAQLIETQELFEHAEYKKLTIADLARNTIKRRTERAEKAESQLASRDALIERLVEAGDYLAQYGSVGKWESRNKWNALIAEYRASKKDSVEKESVE